ncbi:MAG: CHASE2 domain-containing protein [Symploca sp. SIO3E6]|nr:CHASE2 domain-containing protein [Caldora sp. SIO3E6]
MNQCSIFQLNVWRTGLDCTLQLTWGERKQISANLPYPDNLDGLYLDWNRSYLNAYGTPMRGTVTDDCFVTPPTDWKHIAEQARKALLEEFEQWLGDQKLIGIRQRIYRETARKNSQHQKQGGNCVDFLIACNCSELTRLPWEAWEIVPKEEFLAPIHISRTLISTKNEPILVKNSPRRAKPRILAVLADTSELDLKEDRKTVRLLKQVADVQLVEPKEGESGEEFKQRFIEQLVDDRGWDIWIFAGHSNETKDTGGELELAPDAFVSMTEIEEELILAKNQGLQVAIFNSCSGLSLADTLIERGLSQVVVMREKSHDSVNHVFLQYLCQSLAEYKDVQQAVQDACNYLKSERNAYPSGYLIPSLFRHPASGTDLFRIEPLGWRRLWRDWQPSRKEAIALSTFLLLSAMFPVHNLLSDFRYFTQAFYRDVTNQKQQLPPDTPRPVHLVNIDNATRDLGNADIENFKLTPIDRELLARLVKRLKELEVKVIGINYGLYEQTDAKKSKQLAEEIKSAVREQDIWFVFAENEEQQYPLFKEIASLNWSLQGYTNLKPWDVEWNFEPTCKDKSPFAYLLALSSALKEQAVEGLSPSQLLLTSQTDTQDNQQRGFQTKISEVLNLKKNPNHLIPAQPPIYASWWRHSIIDFSVPAENIYQPISAEALLTRKLTDPELAHLKQGIVIITPGGYESELYQGAVDNFDLPLAFNYWCFSHNLRTQEKKECPEDLTGGEINAYLANYYLHWLKENTGITPPWLIRGSIMVALAGFLGKGTTLILLKLKRKHRQQVTLLLVLATAIYGVVVHQMYISVPVSIPVCLPLLMFWTDIVWFLRRKYNA